MGKFLPKYTKVKVNIGTYVVSLTDTDGKVLLFCGARCILTVGLLVLFVSRSGSLWLYASTLSQPPGCFEKSKAVDLK